MNDKLPLTILILAILDGFIALIRVKVNFSVVFDKSIIVYAMVCVVEQFCLFGTFWLFSLKYYETASDLQYIIENQDGEK